MIVRTCNTAARLVPFGLFAAALVGLAPAGGAAPPAKKGPPSLAVDRARLFPAPGREKDLIGGKIAGSNRSATEGFRALGEVKGLPVAGQWVDFRFENAVPYRWVRYEAPAGSYGAVAEVEFYAGERRLGGTGYGSVGRRHPARAWPKALDGLTDSWFECDRPDGIYVGRDLLDQTTARRPEMLPAPGEYPAPVTVSLTSATPGAKLRYTLDGTTPGPSDGLPYEKPIEIDRTTTLAVAAFEDGAAASPATFGTYLVAPKAGPNTFHVGNSITRTAHRIGEYARTAGHRHDSRQFVRPGARTFQLWEAEVQDKKTAWQETLAAVPPPDHFTVQPRDYDVAREAKNEIHFFELIRARSPQVQPWLYAEWTERERRRPTDRAEVPSRQMEALNPALTWEESAGAMLLYVEEVRDSVRETYEAGLRPRVLPSVLAAGWLRQWLAQGRVPGLGPDAFDPMVFLDGVHPGPEGAYLIDATWYAAFYRESPEGKVLPIHTGLTREQSAALQRLAWDVVENYPDCGLYEVGTVPAAAPTFARQPARPGDTAARLTLASTTPGAWFRYTLDGTAPTRTRGYVYCGAVSAPPGRTVKAVAYRSGTADSTVAELAVPRPE